MTIEEENLLWHINATRNELKQNFTPASNALYRIDCIERRVMQMLEELEKLRRR